jgi:hypothetical protein
MRAAITYVRILYAGERLGSRTLCGEWSRVQGSSGSPLSGRNGHRVSQRPSRGELSRTVH